MARRSEPFRPGAPIVAELSSGAIVVDPLRERVLLLHEVAEDRWTLPKGHVEPGESLEAAALRELGEETGLPLGRLDGEVAELAYRFFDPRRGVNVHKTVVYFLGRSAPAPLHPESIFDRAEWVAWDEAIARVPYEGDRQALGAARRGAPPESP